MSIYEELPAIYRPQRAQSDVDAIANAFYEAVLDLNPVYATEEGRIGVETLFPDYSPAGDAAYTELVKKTLADLEAIIPVDDTDLVTLDAMQERLELDLAFRRAGHGSWQLNNITSVVQSVRSSFDLMNRNSAEDWGFIVGRLGNVPVALASLRENLDSARAEGKISPARQLRAVTEQIDAYVAENGYFDELAKEIATGCEQLCDQALEAAAEAKEAYADLAEYIRTVLLPAAPEKDAVGRKDYALYSRYFLGAHIDLDETYAWGARELASIIAAQQEIAEQIKPGASIEEAKQILDADPERVLHGTEELQAWMQRRSDAAVQALAGEHFEIAGPMLNLECRIAPTHEGGIYYTGPSPDFSRPGRMWWSVPEGDDTFGTWRETSTVYHEGVPGHHLQFCIATAMAQSLNKYRANMLWVSGHGEGWALYAERLMTELGFMDDLGDRMGWLDAQRLRAARVVFDIGVHCELPVPDQWAAELGVEPGTIWTPELGYEFLKRNFDATEDSVKFEYLRYLGWPGQAPSYKIGERLWLQLRDEAVASGTELREFHTQALMLGSLGLDVLRRALSDAPVDDFDDDDDEDDDD